jgi:outer membrane protein
VETIMRLSILTFVAVSQLCFAPDATAQYANRSLGVGAQATTSIDHAPQWAVTLEGSAYIESGFDLFLRVPLLITNTPVGAATPSGGGQVFGTGGSLGIRFLFLEERIRPFVGIQLSGLVLFTQPVVDYSVGPGASVGTDFFVSQAVSIGLRASYDLLIELNKPLRHNFGAGLNVAAIF